MSEAALIRALRSPAAYDHPVQDVAVITTHASIVFLAGAFAYKIKRAVDLGFLDYSTLSRRHQMCQGEVRLNRRLAPTVYLGVVPVVTTGTGLAFGGAGDPVEFAVKMRRLSDDRRLDRLLAADAVEPARLDELAELLADFHRNARRGPPIAAMSTPEVVAGNCEDNFPPLREVLGTIVSAEVLDRMIALTRAELGRVGSLVRSRSAEGVACEMHGDLRLEHVYAQTDDPSRPSWEIVDGVEFSERHRFGDPVSDLAFLVMDLRAHGFGWAAKRLADRYFEASGDRNGRPLVSLYVAYRAAVRAKVRALQAADADAPGPQRAAAADAARGHALQVVCELAQPRQRPCVVLMCGLPGTGKSVLAQGLAEASGFQVVRADVVRKELAGLAPTDRAGSGPGRGIYAPEWTERTYAACLERADALLYDGQRVIVDATFRDDEARARFVALAQRRFVPVAIIHCMTQRSTAKHRLDTRQHDASDADWGVYLHMETVWEEFGAQTRPHVVEVDTDGAIASVVERARNALAGIALDKSIILHPRVAAG